MNSHNLALFFTHIKSCQSEFGTAVFFGRHIPCHLYNDLPPALFLRYIFTEDPGKSVIAPEAPGR
jgi:hypothetical protein